MEKQLTASEVRAEAHRHANEVEDMLNAFADLLEAREKAEPMAWRTFDGEGNYDYRDYENNEHYRGWCVSRNGAKYANWVEPLYSHPAPADTERLAEALQPFANLLQPRHASIPDDRPIYGINKAEITAGDLRRANEALTAHSAQAQPPVASVPTLRYFIGGPKACAYVDKPEHVEAIITALCECTGDDSEDYTATDLSAAHSAQAQPPAASVPDWTDAQCVAFMAVGLRHTEYKKGKSPTVEEIRQGAKAALAAQENPNG